MKSLEHRVPPPAAMLLVGVAMASAARLMQPAQLPAAIRVGLAVALAVASATFALPAFAAFRSARTTVNPVNIERASTLVTRGIYRVSRNPMYVALTGLLLCLAVALARPWLLLGPVAFVLFTTRFQIVPEERVMRAKFGADYAAYQERVRRWL